ncbi:MAG: metallophosphoesterase [Candidatus Gastranaerophilales bacterium]
MKKTLLNLILLLILVLSTNNLAIANNVKFVQVADAHYNLNSKYANEILEKTIDSINQLDNIDFVVFTGDNISSPNIEYLDGFMDKVTRLKVPYHIIIGNRDVFKSKDLSKIDYISTIKKHDFFYKHKSPNYVFKKNGYVFIALDGAKEVMPNTVGYFKKDTLDWLETQLVKYEKYPVIIIQHYPLVEPMVRKNHEIYKKEDYLERLDKYNNVLAIIAGHYHSNGEILRNTVYHISSPDLLTSPNYYKIIEISKTNDFSPLIFTELKSVQ